jgi:hypothetical protein
VLLSRLTLFSLNIEKIFIRLKIKSSMPYWTTISSKFGGCTLYT